MSHDFNVVDKSGDVVLTVRHLWPRDPEPCNLCERDSDLTHAVPYYEEPVLESDSQGCYMSCCAACFDRWELWSFRTLAARSAAPQPTKD